MLLDKTKVCYASLPHFANEAWVLFIALQVVGVFIQGVGQYWQLRRLSLDRWQAGRPAREAGRPVSPLGSTAYLHPTTLDTSPSRFEVGMAVTLVLLC